MRRTSNWSQLIRRILTFYLGALYKLETQCNKMRFKNLNQASDLWRTEMQNKTTKEVILYENCEMKLEGNILTITVDISKEIGTSSSGKEALIIGST